MAVARMVIMADIRTVSLRPVLAEWHIHSDSPIIGLLTMPSSPVGQTPRRSLGDAPAFGQLRDAHPPPVTIIVRATVICHRTGAMSF